MQGHYVAGVHMVMVHTSHSNMQQVTRFHEVKTLHYVLGHTGSQLIINH